VAVKVRINLCCHGLMAREATTEKKREKGQVFYGDEREMIFFCVKG